MLGVGARDREAGGGGGQEIAAGKQTSSLHRRQWHLGQALKKSAVRGRVESPSKKKEYSYAKPQS